MTKPAEKRPHRVSRARRACCRLGRHLPDPIRRTDERGLLRSRCRLCGAELVQLFARAWIVSGPLG
jgi:hypothetical protein